MGSMEANRSHRRVEKVFWVTQVWLAGGFKQV